MAATTSRRRAGATWLRVVLITCLGIMAIAAPAAAQLDAPSAIQWAPGCQQYTVTWHAVPGAAAYRIHVTGDPTPIEVTTLSAIIPATTEPTDRTFRIGTVDEFDVEGPLSGPRQASGASLPFSLQALPDITVNEGSAFTIMASLVGQPGVPAPLTTFTWTLDGAPAPYSGATIFKSTAQMSDAGVYHLRGCTECCDELDLVRLIVIPHPLGPPQFVTATRACGGASITWQAVPGAAGYVVHRSGTTDVTVVTNSYTDALPVGVCRGYSVSTLDSFGQTGPPSSTTFSVCGIYPLPSPLSLGPDQIIRVGRPFTLTVPGTFDLPTTTFDWQKNNVSLGAANSPTFSITSLATSNAGSYTCVVSNICGTVTTSAIVLTVVVPFPPPTGVTAAITACRQVTVNCNPVAGALKYFVSRNPAFPGPPPVPPNPPGIFVPTLPYIDTIAPSDSSVNYTYSVAAVGLGDVVGALSNPSAQIKPAALPRLGNPPLSKTVELGANISLSASVIGTSATWRKNGVPFVGGTQNVQSGGLIILQLPFIGVTAAQAGSYDVQVCTACGCINTAAATLTVCQTPVVTPGTLVVLASEGQPTVDLTTTATNAQSVQWYHGGVALLEGGHYTGTGTNMLTIHTPLTEDIGYYELHATGSCTTVIGSPVELKVDPCIATPAITEQPASSQSITLGNPASLTFGTTCCRPPVYQWFHQDGNGDWNPVPGGTSSTLNIPSLTPGDLGGYFAIATNYAKSVVSRFAVINELIPPPPPRLYRFYSYPICGAGVVVWQTSVPLNVSLVVRRGGCGGFIESTLQATPGTSSGSFTIPIADPYVRCVTLECRDASNQLVISPPSVYASSRPPGAVLTASVTPQPNYVAMPFGNAVALQINVANTGCDAYTGDISLADISMAELPAAAVLADGSPAIGLALLPAQLNPGQSRSFPLVYFPVTQPGAGVTVIRDLSLVLEYTQPDLGDLLFMSTIQFMSGGVR